MKVMLRFIAQFIVSVSIATTACAESINAGQHVAQTDWAFDAQLVAEFDRPWSMAFLPDGQLLITEKPGHLYIVDQQGRKSGVQGVPEVYSAGQNGLLDVVLAPDYEHSGQIYFSYVAPRDSGGVLTLMRAKLLSADSVWQLHEQSVLWQQESASTGGHPGGIIAFSPDAEHLFITAGERMQGQFAQDLQDPRGKILRMTLQGEAAADNPWAAESDGTQAYVWTYGHRNPYGLAFDKQGRLWSHEMGPRGGDELNLIEAGKNYGWPLVSNGTHYDGRAIPDHDTRPDLEPPLLYWTPVISPSGLSFYEGEQFPDWAGSALIGGLSAQALVRVAFDPTGQPQEVQRFSMGQRIRDVGVAADGSVWVLEDGPDARLLKLNPLDP